MYAEIPSRQRVANASVKNFGPRDVVEKRPISDPRDALGREVEGSPAVWALKAATALVQTELYCRASNTAAKFRSGQKAKMSPTSSGNRFA